jgi:hypothetical protein
MQATMLSGLARTQHDPAEVRCRCLVCGAHAYALPDVPLSGRCGNCHSLELEPLEPAPDNRRDPDHQRSPPGGGRGLKRAPSGGPGRSGCGQGLRPLSCSARRMKSPFASV